jgi:uncharacterized protein (DUF1015 family)
MQVHPFRALRPPEELAARVSAVPYDVVSTDEARALAGDNPLSLLHVSRPEIDFPPGQDPYAEEVYRRAAANFTRLIAGGALRPDAEASLYVYSQRRGAHAQHSVVATLDAADYDQGLIRRHEKTRVEKENDRVRHIETLRAHTGLVFIAYRGDSAIDRLVAEAQRDRPLFWFEAPDGVEHMGWRIANPARVAELFRRVPVCYIADGHHRAAAAARVARAAGQGGNGCRRFPAALFPAAQLRVQAIHRCVKDLNGLTADRLLAELRSRCRVAAADGEPPPRKGSAGMYVGGRWYRLSWEAPEGSDAVSRLDVSQLQDRVLGPLLGIVDPRADPRLEFTAGPRGVAEITRRVDGGEAAVGFSLASITVDEVLAVSDAGLIMPPKSTWFDPKVRSGLFVHSFGSPIC